MLAGNLYKSSSKWERASEPIIDHDGQRVLIAGLMRPSSKLLWRGIRGCSCIPLCVLLTGALSDHRNPKIGHQHAPIFPQENIPWLDVAVDAFMGMSIVQCLHNLLDIGENDIKRQGCASGVALLKGTIGGVVHHQERDVILYPKLQHA